MRPAPLSKIGSSYQEKIDHERAIVEAAERKVQDRLDHERMLIKDGKFEAACKKISIMGLSDRKKKALIKESFQRIYHPEELEKDKKSARRRAVIIFVVTAILTAVVAINLGTYVSAYKINPGLLLPWQQKVAIEAIKLHDKAEPIVNGLIH